MSVPGSLIVFAKAPRPGCVLTRLQPVLGASRAVRLHCLLVEDTLRRARASGISRLVLCHGDVAGKAETRWLHGCARRYGAGVRVQRGCDLGERMHNALAEALRTSGAALIVGCDCPELTGVEIRRAMLRLHRDSEVVLGPAEDGGYYLVGLRRPERRLFGHMRWGGPGVSRETLRRCRGLGLSVSLGPRLRDLDRAEDWIRLCGEGLRLPLAGTAALPRFSARRRNPR